jgi:hypothetical protein
MLLIPRFNKILFNKTNVPPYSTYMRKLYAIFGESWCAQLYTVKYYGYIMINPSTFNVINQINVIGLFPI